MKPKNLAILTAAIAALSLSSAYSQSIWNAGHGDLGIGYELGNIEPHWHVGEDNETVTINGTAQNFGLAGAEYEPADLMPQIEFNKKTARASGSSWDFVGVSSGADVWVFPETSDPTLPFIGIGAEELAPADWTGNLTITLTGIAGSGVTNGGFFSLYKTDSFGNPTAYMASSGGITSADFAPVVPGSHEHYNWAFTQTGRYDVTFEIAGTHAIDGAKTASATYSFNVVPEPSTFALLGLGLAALGWARRRR